MTGPDPTVLTTPRLLLRLPAEADRDRFTELFCNEDFMVFYPGFLTEEEAGDRFDHMIAVCRAIPFGKQPAVELPSGLVVGYTGVDCIDFEGKTWLEWDAGWCRSAGVSGTPPMPPGAAILGR
jgi:RimJ/RimL family protein N-acetyltransferase